MRKAILLLLLITGAVACQKDIFHSRQYLKGRYTDRIGQVKEPAKQKQIFQLNNDAVGSELSAASLKTAAEPTVPYQGSVGYPANTAVEPAILIAPAPITTPPSAVTELKPQNTPPPEKEPEPLAVISFFLTCSALLLVLMPMITAIFFPLIIAGVTTGIISLVKFARNKGKYKLKGLAIASVSCGCLLILLLFIPLLLILPLL